MCVCGGGGGGGGVRSPCVHVWVPCVCGCVDGVKVAENTIPGMCCRLYL